MMEEGEVGALPPIGTYQRTSSLYDVEMDSQPSLEVGFMPCIPLNNLRVSKVTH